MFSKKTEKLIMDKTQPEFLHNAKAPNIGINIYHYNLSGFSTESVSVLRVNQVDYILLVSGIEFCFEFYPHNLSKFDKSDWVGQAIEEAIYRASVYSDDIVIVERDKKQLSLF